MAVVYGNAINGLIRLNPQIQRTFQTGQLASVPVGMPVIHSYKPPNQTFRDDLRGANGGAAQTAAINTMIAYFANPQDVGPIQYFSYNHERDNDTGAIASQYKAEWAVVLASVKPAVNALRTSTVLWGPIFSSVITGATPAVAATWIAAGVDFVGCDPYANLSLITNFAAIAAAQGVPWIIGEFGTNAQAISTDLQNLNHMQGGKNAWDNVANPPNAVCWFDQYTSLITTTLAAGCSIGAGSISVADLPGPSGGAHALPSSSPIIVDPLATSDSVTTNVGSNGGGPYNLLFTPALAHNHSSGATVWLSPTAVAYWRSLNTTSGGTLAPPVATHNKTTVAALTINITLPATINAGDMIYIFESEQATAPTVSAPAFSLVTPGSGTAGRTNLQLTCLKKTAVGTEGGTVVVVTSTASTTKTVVAVVWPGVLAAVSASAGDNGASSANVVAPNAAIAGAHYGVLTIGAVQTAAARTWVPGSGYTEAAHDSGTVAASTALGVFYNDDTGGATSTGAVTNVVSAAAPWVSMTLVLAPGSNSGGTPLGTVPAFADGTVAHQADLRFALQPPAGYFYQNTAQATIITATSTLITFDVNLYDTELAGPTHSTTVQPSRWQPLTPGFYLIIATLNWVANATGARQLDVRKNSAGGAAGGTRVDVDARAANPTLISSSQVIAQVQMNGTTDYLEMFGYQQSGGNLSVLAAATAGGWTGSVSLITRWMNN